MVKVGFSEKATKFEKNIHRTFECHVLCAQQRTCQNTIFGSSGFSFQFLISKHQGSGFSFQFLISKLQGSGFSFHFLISKIQGSGFSFQFLKNYHDLTIFYSDFEFCSGMLLPQLYIQLVNRPHFGT